MADTVKPKTAWTGFLASAPYMIGAVTGAMRYDDLGRYPDLVRAIIYYDIFDAEVSNGGVMQYFFNQAFHLPDFARAAEIAKRHPDLAEGAAFMAEAHAAWDKVAQDVARVRGKANAASPSGDDEWPEELFSDNRFEELENRFFAANDQIRMKLYAAICREPEAYLDIIPDKRDASYHFENGFPIGPNQVETKHDVLTVWFTPDRMHVEVESRGFLNFDRRDRIWVDFKTGTSAQREFDETGLIKHATTRGVMDRHGIAESYNPNGQVDHTALSLNGVELVSIYSEGLTLANKKALKELLSKADDLD